MKNATRHPYVMAGGTVLALVAVALTVALLTTSAGRAGDGRRPPPAPPATAPPGPFAYTPKPTVCPPGAVTRPVPAAAQRTLMWYVRLLDRGWYDAARAAAVAGSPASTYPYEQTFSKIRLISIGDRYCKASRSARIEFTIEVFVRRALNSRWEETQETAYVSMLPRGGRWYVLALEFAPAPG